MYRAMEEIPSILRDGSGVARLEDLPGPWDPPPNPRRLPFLSLSVTSSNTRSQGPLPSGPLLSAASFSANGHLHPSLSPGPTGLDRELLTLRRLKAQCPAFI